MNLKNAAAFLIITSIAFGASVLINEGYYVYRIGIGFLIELSSLYLLISLLNSVLFLLVGLSYSRSQYNPESRKLIGLFLAIVSGGGILLQCYNLLRGLNEHWYGDSPFVFFARQFVFLVVPIAALLVGISLAGTNRERIRKAMVWMMIVSAVASLMLFYFTSSELMVYGMPHDLMDKVLYCLFYIKLTLPVSQFFWALAVYKRIEQPNQVNDNTSVLDQL